MRYLSALIVTSVVLCAAAASADEPKVNPIEAGDGALMFNYGGLFNSTPSNLDQVGVGGRYFISDTMAVRAALGINYLSKENENKDSNGNTTTSDNSSNDLGLEGGVEMTMFSSPTVTIYMGGLLQAVLGSNDPGTGGDEVTHQKFGLMGLLGATYFFTEYVSVGAEYRLGFVRDVEETKKSDNSTTTVTDTTFGTGSAGFHLSFWF